jgi:type IV pilus assembly protein PilQ
MMLASLLLVARGVAGAYGVTGLRIEPAGETTRIVIETDSPYSYHDFSLDSPPRIVVDFENAQHKLPGFVFPEARRGGVETIRSSQFTTETVRITFVLSGPKDYSLFETEKGLMIVFENTEGSFELWSSSGLPTLMPAEDVPSSIATDSATAPVTQDVTAPVTADATAPVTTDVTAPVVADESKKTEIAAPAETWQFAGEGSTVPLAKPISVDFEDASIKAVLRAFSEFSGQSIVAGKTVQGRITAKINDVPWDQALQMILKANGYAMEEKGGVFMVDKLENLRATEALEGLEPTVIRLNYLMAADVIATIEKMLTDRGSVSLDAKSNALIVTDVPSKIKEIVSIIPELDRETKQVTIKSKLVFVNTSDLRQMGIDWKLDNLTNPRTDVHGEASAAGARISDPFLQLSLGTFRAGVNLSGLLQSLEEQQLIEVEAQPQITTLDNLEAQVFVGERTPIRVLDVGAQTTEAATIQLIETGIRLTVTPHITNNDKIVMDLKAERSQAIPDPSEFGVKFQTQEGTTTLLVNDGQTAVIGGLTTLDTVESERRMPILSKIPLLGRLFKYKSTSTAKVDLLILVTPYIVRPESG